MRKFTIVGGGQSGLQLGIGLLKAGHQVRIVQNRTAAEVAQGKVLSSQCMFSNAVQQHHNSPGSLGISPGTPVKL